MQQKLLFEYAVIRIVPKVEREEFLNAGVILYCAKVKFLAAKFHIDADRMRTFCIELEPSFINKNLQAIQRISSADVSAGPISRLDAAARFRWLTATRSTVVQTSKVHPGFCDDPELTLEHLFKQLVL